MAILQFINNQPQNQGLKCINALKNYIPTVGTKVSLRHCYYYLFSQGLINPTKTDYQKLSHWLEWAKRNGIIPWDWIIDTSRRTHSLSLAGDIVEYSRDAANRYYTRDYWKQQDYLIILLCEKEAIAPAIASSKIVLEYGVPLFVTRGYLSYQSLYDDIARFIGKYKQHFMKTLVFVLTDLDPDGELIFEDVKKKFAYAQKHWTQLGIKIKCIKKIAMTQGVVKNLNLSGFGYPIFKTQQKNYINLLNKYGWGNFPKAATNKKENQMGKKLTKNKSFIQKNGWNGIEIDVLSPHQLESIILNEITPYYDFNTQALEIEKERLEKEALFTELLIPQNSIDNATTQLDISQLDAALLAQKKSLGLIP